MQQTYRSVADLKKKSYVWSSDFWKKFWHETLIQWNFMVLCSLNFRSLSHSLTITLFQFRGSVFQPELRRDALK